MLAIGVKEKEEKRTKEGDPKCLEDTSSSNTSGGDKKASRTLEASSNAEAWKLRTSCCNNLAACHFQVIQLKIPFFWLLHLLYFQWGNHASVVELSTVVLQADSSQVQSFTGKLPPILILVLCKGEGSLPSRCFLSGNERVCLC